MNDVDELIGLARDLADEIVGVAAGLLSVGVDIEACSRPVRDRRGRASRRR